MECRLVLHYSYTFTRKASNYGIFCFDYNSIAVPFPYMVAGVGRAVQDVVGQEKSEKSPENRAKKLANGSDVWYTNPCVTALLICDDAGGGRRAAVTTAAQTGNFRGVCPI